MPTIAELIKKATGSSPDEMAQAVKTLEELYGQTAMGQQDFGPEDSTIASTVAHPIKGAGKLAEWFRGNVNTAAGYSDPFDNPNPLLGPSMDKKAEAGLNLAGMLQTGAMPFAPKSAGGTVGTFIGPKAANWDKSAADKATKLLDSGADPAQVWKEHLIGRMPDKSLFSEIDDSGALYKKDMPTWSSLSKDMPINESFNHESLYNAYPEVSNTTLSGSLADRNSTGSFDADNNIIRVDAALNKKHQKQVASTTLHELQHAIQQREGWARGGSPEAMREEALNMLRRDVASGDIASAEQAMEMLPMAQRNAYQRLTGEAQARATQDRMNMNMDERRNSYPLAGDKLSDIPLKNLISRYGDNGPSISMRPDTEFTRAHALAQKNAALPVEQGGLGLHPENTAMERANVAEIKMLTKQSRIGDYPEIQVHFDDTQPEGFFIDQTGQPRLMLPSVLSRHMDHVKARGGRYIDSALSPLEDDLYIRTSKNIDDVNHIKNKTHRGSRNWNTGEEEGGLSVAKTPEFMSNFMSIVKGKKIGEGSDSEPLLDINSVEYVKKYNDDIYRKELLQKAKKMNLSNNDVRLLKSSRMFVNGGELPVGTRDINKAAFDPMKKDSANILASVLGGTALASQYDKKKKLKDMK